eukprot:2125297-Alexandrium_andersonii.AAC.1
MIGGSAGLTRVLEHCSRAQPPPPRSASLTGCEPHRAQNHVGMRNVASLRPLRVGAYCNRCAMAHGATQPALCLKA